MKRVLLISNKVFHYRVSNYNYFARRFKDTGWEFVVRANELEEQNPYPLEFDFRAMPFNFDAYRQEIKHLRPDVVILFLHLKDPFTWMIMHWLKLRGIPIVYWNKGINLEIRHPGPRNLIFYYVHALSDAIILYTPNEKRHIHRFSRHKVFVANNTINFESFPAVHDSKDALRAEFGVPFKKVVLFVGRMRPVKKVDHLIAVFNSIDDPDIGCVIVGDAMGVDVNSMATRGNVRYLGEIHDPANIRISKLFRMADLFCIPGDVGLGLNQAFFWGLPVVTEAGLQPPELCYMTSGRNGFIVPEDDIQALREKILLLLHDDVLRSKFSRSAHEDILRHASIETMFSGFLDCLSALDDPGSRLHKRARW